jgi:Iron-containing redox enzyme
MLETLHEQLARDNHDRLVPSLPDGDWRTEVDRDHARRILEGEVVEQERARIAERAAEAPSDADAFVAWFEGLQETGPGQNDTLFPWLATTATSEQMRWFMYQEVAGEAGFEDLVALTQVRMDTRAKLELARNFWDEMGRGRAGGMHGPMLSRLADALALSELHEPIVWESLALGNIMLGLAANRRYAYQSIGALGAIELTAPWRAAHVDAGLVRLGIAPRARHYFALHATLDIKHSAAWNAEVLHPIVAADPRTARAIAEGALLRLDAGRRCFERYRRELWAGTQPSAASLAQPVARSTSPMSLR